LTGGIVQIPAECKTAELKNGMGVTIYHYVESIEDVSMASFVLVPITPCFSHIPELELTKR
jgi:hypothetical protein